MDVSVKAFLEYLGKSGKVSACETYRHVLNSYARWLGKSSAEDLELEDFMPLKLEEYMQELSPRTANVFVSACRSYMKFRRFNFVPSNVMEFLREEQFYRAVYNISYTETPVVDARAIDIETLKKLLRIVEDPMLKSGIILHAYTGARPIELARPYEIKHIDLENVGYGYVVDLKNCIMEIITAKTKRKRLRRLIPFPSSMKKYIVYWFENIDVVVNYERPREWLTKKLIKYRKVVGFNISAKTFRRTVETYFRQAGFEQWFINYWLGHTHRIPDVYSDWVKLIKFAQRKIKKGHYLISSGILR